jgi:multidrug efflux pump subunit AcrB
MGIVRFALRFPYTFHGLAALILFLGLSAIAVMPIDIFPEINIPVVTVIWQYTGLSTPEMEQRVTTYSQYAISTAVSGIKNMEAQTLNGISVQRIFFNRTSISTSLSHKLLQPLILYASCCQPESKRRWL